MAFLTASSPKRRRGSRRVLDEIQCFADLMFTEEGSANVQKILIAEDALGYQNADRHHGKLAPGREKS
jgi:hypothetical protein